MKILRASILSRQRYNRQNKRTKFFRDNLSEKDNWKNRKLKKNSKEKNNSSKDEDPV